jgi:hypothetical protein
VLCYVFFCCVALSCVLLWRMVLCIHSSVEGLAHSKPDSSRAFRLKVRDSVALEVFHASTMLWAKKNLLLSMRTSFFCKGIISYCLVDYYFLLHC